VELWEKREKDKENNQALVGASSEEKPEIKDSDFMSKEVEEWEQNMAGK
tara:strand:+ start:325 stop:471 length:147 start_codon:yes stop_codon:yes gene_type:complete